METADAQGGHFLGQILLDKFTLHCIYIALLNNSAGHSFGHFGRQISSGDIMEEIVAFLDNETSKISDIRATIESQISTLLAYRKSLIHECVTGQRRISEADVARVRRYDPESMRQN